MYIFFGNPLLIRARPSLPFVLCELVFFLLIANYVLKTVYNSLLILQFLKAKTITPFDYILVPIKRKRVKNNFNVCSIIVTLGKNLNFFQKLFIDVIGNETVSKPLKLQAFVETILHTGN